MNTLRLAALLATLVCASLHAAEDAGQAGAQPPPRGEVSQDAKQPQPQARACYGGLEDGKVVVRAGRLADEPAETTVERCRVGGGFTDRMPRSPTISAGRPAVA